MDSQEQLFEEAKLGIEVEDFLRSKTGRYLRGRAVAQYEEAKEGILSCNPDSFFGRRKIKQHQQQAALADMFMKWCADVIAHGREAEAFLDEE